MSTRERAQRWTQRAFGLLQTGRAIVGTYPDEAPSNCLLWALQQMERHGGSLELLPSQFGPWLHARWIAPDGVTWEYYPAEPKYRQETPPPLFLGAPQLVPKVAPEPSTLWLGRYVVGFYP